MAEEQDELAAAESNINSARQIVERQKQLIANLQKAGSDTRVALQNLEMYETSLRIYEGHRDYLKSRGDKH